MAYANYYDVPGVTTRRRIAPLMPLTPIDDLTRPVGAPPVAPIAANINEPMQTVATRPAVAAPTVAAPNWTSDLAQPKQPVASNSPTVMVNPPITAPTIAPPAAPVATIDPSRPSQNLPVAEPAVHAAPAYDPAQIFQLLTNLAGYTGTQRPSSVGLGDDVQAELLSAFGPGNDLRGTQISPYDDERLQNTRAAVDAARRRLDTFAYSPFGEVGAGSADDPMYADIRAAIDRAQAEAGNLKDITGGPSRRDIALETLRQFDEAQAPVTQRGIRDIGRAAAAFGRLGAGMTTNELTEYGLTRNRDRDRLQRSLVNDASAQELDDRLNVAGFNATNALRRAGLFGDTAGRLAGLSDTIFNRGRSVRDEARGERGARLAYDQARLAADQGIFSTIAALENQHFNQGAAQRNELRGERGYQGDMAREALDNRVRQITLEDALRNSDFNREQARLNSILAAAYGRDPTGALLSAGAQVPGGMDLGPLLLAWMQRQNRPATGTGTVVGAPVGGYYG